MNILSIIANNTMLIAIIVIIIFLFIQFYLKPKYLKPQTQSPKMNEMNQDVKTALVKEQTEETKQSLGSRMITGFSVMKEKLQNNEYLKNMVNEQKDISSQEVEEDPYATDFNKVGKVDF